MYSRLSSSEFTTVKAMRAKQPNTFLWSRPAVMVKRRRYGSLSRADRPGSLGTSEPGLFHYTRGATQLSFRGDLVPRMRTIIYKSIKELHNSEFWISIISSHIYHQKLIKRMHMAGCRRFGLSIMTSPNGNIFRVILHLCGEFTVDSPQKGQ